MPEPDDEPTPLSRYQRLRARLRQLILMRETGPKSAAWHRARTNMIWRLHREMDETSPTSDERREQG